MSYSVHQSTAQWIVTYLYNRILDSSENEWSPALATKGWI